MSYYLLAETLEEMETLIEEEMLDKHVQYYYIHDFYNIDPQSKLEKFNIKKGASSKFINAKFGIWACSDIFITNARNITQYVINKPYGAIV